MSRLRRHGWNGCRPAWRRRRGRRGLSGPNSDPFKVADGVDNISTGTGKVGVVIDLRIRGKKVPQPYKKFSVKVSK